MWLGEDQRINTTKAHVLKEIGLCFLNRLSTPHLIANINGEVYVLNQRINNHALPIIMEGYIFKLFFTSCCFIVDLLMQRNFKGVNMFNKDREQEKQIE